ncbi:MAG: GNAT family N-acetyltransferase [Candidatus Falkowbacteria bacterium]
MKKELVLRQAMLKDVDQMYTLTNHFAEEKKMLPKSKPQLLGALFNYHVAVVGEESIGTCGVKIWGDQSVELVSLAIQERCQGHGVGTRLIQENVKKCCKIGFRRFFAMTVVPNFFTRIGFEPVDYSKSSLKVWVDCATCPRNAAHPGDKECNEKAVEIVLG